eukprot:2683513-Prorocentrum_lima.AAC.1
MEEERVAIEALMTEQLAPKDAAADGLWRSAPDYYDGFTWDCGACTYWNHPPPPMVQEMPEELR